MIPSEPSDALALYRVAVKKEQEDRLHRQWCTYLPLMSQEAIKYMSFGDYVDRVTGRNIDWRPAEEIIAEIEELHGRKS